MLKWSALPLVFVLNIANCGGEDRAAAPAADPELVQAGLLVFEAHCSACHAAQTTGAAPGLGGLYGRPAGALDYPYSPAFQAADFTWDADQLAAFLAQPREVVPDNQMAFWGLPDADERAALVAYIGTLEP